MYYINLRTNHSNHPWHDSEHGVEHGWYFSKDGFETVAEFKTLTEAENAFQKKHYLLFSDYFISTRKGKEPKPYEPKHWNK